MLSFLLSFPSSLIPLPFTYIGRGTYRFVSTTLLVMEVDYLRSTELSRMYRMLNDEMRAGGERIIIELKERKRK